MIRDVDMKRGETFDKRELAEIAASGADYGLDAYSEYRVGAAVVIEYKDTLADSQRAPENLYSEPTLESRVYAASNINLSGMEVKIHAEQLALFQAILDMEEHGMKSYATLDSVMVVTSENDLALKCGHCLQVFAGVCEYYNWDMTKVNYNAAAGNTLYDDRGNPDGVHFDYDLNTLDELIGETYVNGRGGNA